MLKRKAGQGLLLEIFSTFFKIGLFTFGGGYAMIPLIEREVATNKGWIEDDDEFLDIFALSQSVPGAIAINFSTFVGYKLAGLRGALAATGGVIMPSFIVITLIAGFFIKFQENPLVAAAFIGVRAVVVALILMAVLRVGKDAIRNKLSASITVVTVLLIVVLKVNTIYIITGGILIGLATYFFLPPKGPDANKKGRRGD